jgi:alpha-1,6-mannosyl-glycoprotein beta-1,2-N-acetylglucosaminyltransferase
LDEGGNLPPVDDEDKIPNIDPQWNVKYNAISGYNRGFKGWGGWGDRRDHDLCRAFASMYSPAA